MKQLKEVTGKDGKVWTKEQLRELISTNDKAAIKALLTIYEYQTEYEQAAGYTQVHNTVGFSGTDGFLSKFVSFYNKRKYFTPKMMAIIKKKMPKYTNQIMNIMKETK